MASVSFTVRSESYALVPRSAAASTGYEPVSAPQAATIVQSLLHDPLARREITRLRTVLGGPADDGPEEELLARLRDDLVDPLGRYALVRRLPTPVEAPEERPPAVIPGYVPGAAAEEAEEPKELVNLIVHVMPPSGAAFPDGGKPTLFIGGAEVGPAPKKVQVEKGKAVSIRATKAGYEDAAKTVTLRKDGTEILRMAKAPPRDDFDSMPFPVRRIDDERVLVGKNILIESKDKEFQAKTVQQLAQLHATEPGQRLIADIDGSPHPFKIAPAGPQGPQCMPGDFFSAGPQESAANRRREGGRYVPGPGTGATVFHDPDTTDYSHLIRPGEPVPDHVRNVDPGLALGHEMVHAQRMQRGVGVMHDNPLEEGETVGFISPPAEVSGGLVTENELRASWNPPHRARTTYP